ncbi:maltokinase N-terminal cap-like domain-containing protein [Pseudonocardia ailaonensis]|uniref:maltokinase N-terminal cap-like domain-containing protein n=1 Tax=Pseudonocardia ailaonensis TaxID=367279 RepID=UPI0031E0CE5D
MAIVHRTILTPTKLELLAAWLPGQDWYRGIGDPALTKAGGFRLDDPAGEVGIELMIVTDTASPDVDAYLVPLAYRAAPAGGTPVGTMEHGVLGLRHTYDGPTDPVLRAQARALLRGEVLPQAQSESNTVDRTVHVEPVPDAADVEFVRHLVSGSSGAVSATWLDADGTRHRAAVLRTAS